MKKIAFFLAVLLAASACGSRYERMTVASERVDCQGVGLMKCLVVKPYGHSDWELFYNHIEGFDYEEGYEYVIDVEKFMAQDPPADGSSVEYVLRKIVSKKRTDSDIPFSRN